MSESAMGSSGRVDVLSVQLATGLHDASVKGGSGSRVQLELIEDRSSALAERLHRG